MCCKLPGIEELNKPPLAWCQHCNPSSGCRIYESRPEPCRRFICGWMTNPALDERWKPSRSKIMLTYEIESNRAVAHVDPARPDAWRKEPFYSTLKAWARKAVEHLGQVVVWEGAEAIVLLPEKDVRLGHVGPDQLIVTVERRTPYGMEWDAELIHRDHADASKIIRHGAREQS